LGGGEGCGDEYGGIFHDSPILVRNYICDERGGGGVERRV
jgi:hypothetical protein